jgi:glycine reductase
MPYRVVHYINQFFAGIGGEEMASHAPESREGIVGPGMALAAALGDEAQVVGTVICGDSYFAENIDKARSEILEMIRGFQPDAVVAGPAFNAGRYGTACGGVCDAISSELGIPVVTGMFPENPGVDLYRKSIYIVPTADSARGLRKAMPGMAGLILKLLKGEEIGTPGEEGYLPRGIRKNCFVAEVGAERAVKMLVKKLRGETFTTEYPMPAFDRVAPAPAIADLSQITVALVTSGGIVPNGNPDHIEASSASKFGEYSIAGVKDLKGNYATAHGGYDATYANEDANRVLPLDVLREMEAEGVFGRLHDKFYSTVGNGTSVANSRAYGKEIAGRLRQAGVDAVILTST